MSSIIKFTKTDILRDSAGRVIRSGPWRYIYPQMVRTSPKEYKYILPSGSILRYNYRGKSILKQRWESKEKYFNDFQREGLTKVLSELGIKTRIINIILSRPIHHFLRIEEFVNGLVDALVCAYPIIFDRKGKDIRILRSLYRKIVNIGTFNLQLLLKDYKAFMWNIFHTKASSVTLEKIFPSNNNIFRIFLKTKMFKNLNKDFKTFQILSHLISSRQFPYMGKRTENQSLEDFKSVIQRDYEPPSEFIEKMFLVGCRIGRICKRIRPIPISENCLHYSINSSGELDHPISLGAQAGAVKEVITSELTQLQDNTFIEDHPVFGKIQHLEGFQIWQYLFRDNIAIDEFGTPRKVGYPKDQPGRLIGYDEVLGKQLFYLAYKRIKQIPIIRVTTVAEMGDKARIVTVAPWWLGIVEAPIGHLLTEIIMYHPSAFSSFHRQDQTWEAAAMLTKKLNPDREQYPLLSSDLKNATNYQVWSVTKAIVRGLLLGYGLKWTQYLDDMISLIGPRYVLFPDMETIVSKTGIMMGEPMTKPCLTLLNLCIEELSFLQYIDKEIYIVKNLPSPYRNWRVFHVGGDDHLAYGPEEYLETITKNHLLAGSVISPDKHAYSKIAVAYCERVLFVSNLIFRKRLDNDNYPNSLIIDSIKVRLLERGLSTLLLKDNKNVAIGKASQLCGALKWLPRNENFWPRTHKYMIKGLFIKRMGPFLPSEKKHYRAFHLLNLPKVLGGLDMALDEDEMYSSYLQCSPLIRWITNAISLGKCDSTDLKLLSMLNTNTSTRGVDDIEKYSNEVISQLEDYPNMVNALTWKQLSEKYPALLENNRYTIAIAKNMGYYSFSEYVKYSFRGAIFQSLLCGKNISIFNTRPYVYTIRKLYKLFEEKGFDKYTDKPLSRLELRNILRTLSPHMFFDINQITCADLEGENPEDFNFVDRSYRDLYTKGFPTLSLGKHFLGLHNLPTGNSCSLRPEGTLKREFPNLPW
nr:TPA_asm: RNA-dependent RNA polymerase [Matryoshka RNA virus 4]